jgi:hypothetical protein
VQAPTSTTQGRVKTQWTGNLSIPEIDAGAAPKKSRLPMLLGAILVVGGAAGAAAFVATRGGGSAPSSGQASGAPLGNVVPPVAPPGTPSSPPHTVPPADPPPLAFEWAQVRILSVPAGADVKDLTLDKVIGHTPFSFKLKPSRTARQFELHHKGYLDAVIEVVPDREKIETTEKLERGTGRRERRPPIGTAGKIEPTTPGAIEPETKGPLPPAEGPGSAVKPPTPPPPTDDDCGDPPCLKRDPSRLPAGSGSAS